MDPRTVLDHALFQLTPTRTRCDLVIFAGKKSEKIASGLLEPFVAHLRSAKDQISRGGYSTTLKPANSDGCPWFTKATLERFVKFVSTPEVLERFVTIEREIDQIESSIESNEQSNGTASAQGTIIGAEADRPPYKGESETRGSGDAEPEENPKTRLQRVLESRRRMLKKEQAMAYARALVSGFEMDYIYDLVSFSDAFGALRLREACINFLELCNKKNEDKIWMDEVAAVQASYMATPGIMLNDSTTRLASLDTSEGTDNGSSMESNVQQTEGVAQTPTWASHLPQYMQNAQGPMFQQIPPYPGYAFQYPGHMPWPANYQDPGMYLDRDVKGQRYRSKKKEKFSQKSGESVETDHSSSTSDPSDEQEHGNEHEASHSKKHKKRSSRKVVIRNINYVTSGRNQESSSSDSDSNDKDKTKRQHEQSSQRSNKTKNALDAGDGRNDDVQKEDKKDGNWDIFQNLLMSDMDSRTAQVQEEQSIDKAYGEEMFSSSDNKLDKPKYLSDSFIMTERSTGGENEVKFDGVENFHGLVKRSIKNEELLTASRAEGEYYLQNAHLGLESSVVKPQKEEDWIIGNNKETSIDQGRKIDDTMFGGGDRAPTNHKKDVILDDSFMVQSRISNEPSENQPKADIFMVSNIVGANESKNNKPEDLKGNSEVSNFYEPEDLYMLPRRDSAPEHGLESWKPGINYGNENLSFQNVASQSKSEANGGANGSKTRTSKKVDGKMKISKAPGGPLGRSKSDVPLRSKTSSIGNRLAMSKAEKEEEKRKKMEEVRIERQKRIAERSAAKGLTKEAPTRSSKENKRSAFPTKNEKTKLQGPVDENRKSHKPVMRSSTIDRLATARTGANKQISTEPKVGQNRKTASKGNAVIKTSAPQKTKGTREGQKNTSSSDKKNGPSNFKSSVQEKSCIEDSISAEVKEGKNEIKDLETVKVLHTVTSAPKKTKGTREGQENTSSSDKKNGPSNFKSSVQEKSCIEDSISAEVREGKNEIKDLETVKVLHTVTSVETTEANAKDASDDKECIEDKVDDHVETTPQAPVHPTVGNDLKSPELKSDHNGDEKKKISFSPEITVLNISTPPPDIETNPESVNSRKKWNNGESSPKMARGFRKLLLFGRRS